MKIRSLLRFAALVPLALALVVVVIYLVAAARLRTANAQADLVDEVTMGAFQLNMLTYDYITVPSDRPKQQWQAKHRFVGTLLDQIQVNDPEQSEVLEWIRHNHVGIADVFSQLIDTSEAEPATAAAIQLNEEWSRRLAGQLLQRSHDMISSAQTLGNESRAELVRVQQVSDRLVLAIIVAFSGVFLATLAVVGRKVGAPLTRLYHGVQVVGRGDLDVEIAVQSNDEIGDISQAFNESARSLRESRAALEEEVADRRLAEKKVRHLNDVLRAIRNVNQLIAREHDRDRLLHGVCDALVQGRGFNHAWIVLLDGNRNLTAAAEAGLGDRFLPLVEQIRSGHLCQCLKTALSQSEVVVVTENSPECADCALVERDRHGRSLAVRLERAGEVFGAMATSVSDEFASDKEDQELFQEAAGDVSLALHTMQLDVERRRAEETVQLNESRLEALWHLGQMTEATLKELTDFALEEAVRLTKSQIGYLAFLNEDETVLTMHSWSKTAMKQCEIVDKPIVYPVETTGLWGEAVRQRKPIITNDYAAPNPCKKGHPDGHVPVQRHMNTPIFDGDRIVAVAGVGNKEDDYDDSDVLQLTLLIQGMWSLIQRIRAGEALRNAHDELEVRVEQRTAELARSNAELEQFAYAASHDLQEPLRMVASYVTLLAQRYQGQLDKDADDFIAFAVDGAKRMQQLIEDLLAYSRVGTRGREFKPTDFNNVVDEALQNLQVLIDEQAAVVTRGDMPTLNADRTQLGQLIQNLIGNAIKFHREEPPRVHLAAEKSGKEWLFSVQDNGIGMDPKYHDRVFAIFQRLHTREEYPGTGIGLAVCKRIVERHGGRIWFESEPGKGTMFQFTLSDQEGAE